MSRIGLLLLLTMIGLPTGCAPAPIHRTPEENAMFGAVAFRVHPTFTQVKDWTGDSKPDGIEAVIEAQDSFGDPTRTTGVARFELYTFEAATPTHRGRRLALWSASLDSKADQLAHWDPAARGYSFQLGYPHTSSDRAYVLLAQLNVRQTRLFSELIIEPSKGDGFHGDRRTKHAPAAAPGHGL